MSKKVLRNTYYVIILIVCAVLLHFFLVRGMRFFLVPSRSMEPTLHPDDHLLTLTESAYMRGDIVVLRDPVNPGEYLVKRIVGVGGDEIAVEIGGLFIDGEYASEPYIKEPMSYTLGPIEVPDGEVVVLGDNRNESEDSSRWRDPTVPVDAIVGKVRYIYLPRDRARAVHAYPLTGAGGG